MVIAIPTFVDYIYNPQEEDGGFHNIALDLCNCTLHEVRAFLLGIHYGWVIQICLVIFLFKSWLDGLSQSGNKLEKSSLHHSIEFAMHCLKYHKWPWQHLCRNVNVFFHINITFIIIKYYMHSIHLKPSKHEVLYNNYLLMKVWYTMS